MTTEKLAEAARIPLVDARNDLSGITQRVERGEWIVITKHGKDVAVILPAAVVESMTATIDLLKNQESAPMMTFSGTVEQLREMLDTL